MESPTTPKQAHTEIIEAQKHPWRNPTGFKVGRTFSSHDLPAPVSLFKTEIRTLDGVYISCAYGETIEEAEGNAAFIVKAVNNFDALVEASKRLRSFLELRLMDSIKYCEKLESECRAELHALTALLSRLEG